MVSKNIDAMGVHFVNLKDAMDVTKISMRDMNKYIRMNNLQEIAGVGYQDKLTGAVLTYGQVVKDATIQNRRFKMEWLSIMFTGMALERTFGGIVKAQESLWGITQLVADAWTVVMIPVMEQLLPIIIDLTNAFMNLPEPVKEIIGWVVLLLAGLGTLLTTVGMLVLFWTNGLAPILAGMGGLSGIVESVSGAVAGLGSAFAVIAVVIIALIISIVNAFRENFMGMKTIVTDLWNYIKQMFGGIFQIFKGVFDLIKALLKGDGDAVMRAVGNIIIGVLNTIIGAIGLAVNIMQTIMVGSIRLLVGIVQAVINGLIAGASEVSKLLGGKGIKFRIDLVGLIGKLDMSMIKLPKIPSLQTGGYIKKEGLAYLHAGEAVVPEGQGAINFSPNITVNATISGSYDVRKLADELNNYWAQSFQRSMRSRGSV